MSAQQQNTPNSQDIYKKISKFVPENEWKIHAPLIDKINRLKKEKNYFCKLFYLWSFKKIII